MTHDSKTTLHGYTLDESLLEGLEHGTRAVAHSELGQDARGVVLDGAFGGAKRLGNFLVAVTSRHEAKDLDLALRQGIGRAQRIEVTARVTESAQHVLGHGRSDDRAPGRNRVHSLGQDFEG